MFLDTNRIQRQQEAEQRIKATERTPGTNVSKRVSVMSLKGSRAGLEGARLTLA